jgi:hypothetical protein
MMRIYFATTIPGLARAHADGVLRVDDGTVSAHGVTPALREWYVEGDVEELEFAAMGCAARDCLSLLASDPGASRRRVVVAADVADALVSPDNTAARSRVRVTGTVPMSSVVSVHVDEPEAGAAVSAAADALAAADGGDEEASFLVDGAEAHDLLWYDVSEIDHLVG